MKKMVDETPEKTSSTPLEIQIKRLIQVTETPKERHDS